jgi:hypothetical protein
MFLFVLFVLGFVGVVVVVSRDAGGALSPSAAYA